MPVFILPSRSSSPGFLQKSFSFLGTTVSCFLQIHTKRPTARSSVRLVVTFLFLVQSYSLKEGMYLVISVMKYISGSDFRLKLPLLRSRHRFANGNSPSVLINNIFDSYKMKRNLFICMFCELKQKKTIFQILTIKFC